jgi:hypothetical protein
VEVARPEAFLSAMWQMRGEMQDHPGRKAFAELGTAATIDMTNAFGGLPTRNFQQGQFDEAESVTRKAHDLQPASQYAAAVFVAVRLQTGKIEEARAAVASLPPAPVSRVLHVNVEQAAGNRAEADAGLQLLIEKDSDSAAFQIAQIYAQREDGDKVFEWLERTWANRDPGVSYLLFDVYLKPYRSDPRFAAFCRTIGLPLPAGKTNPAVLPPSPARTGATSIAIAQAQPVEPR